jgi:hypothetical protein
MFLRTSEHPIDVVYSVMGLFGVQIDPYRKNRDATYLFNDLARKAAASTITKAIGSPCWLTLGRITSVNAGDATIPRDPVSRLIPQFPNIQPNQTPTYNDGRSVVDLIESSGNYIRVFDLQFITHSHPHIINARVSWLRKGDIDVRRNRLTFRTKAATCHYQDFNGRLQKRGGSGIVAVYVGKVESMTAGKIAWPRSRMDLRTKLYNNGRYLLFMEYRGNQWQLVGNGIFMPSVAKWNPPPNRYIFTVGENAQQQKSIWRADMRPADARVTPFRYHSYGIIPLPDFLTPTAATQPRSIFWYGYKGYDVPSQPTEWENFILNFDMAPLLELSDSDRDQRLVFPKPLYVVEAPTSNPPDLVQEDPHYQVRELGEMDVSYSWAAWPLKQCQVLALDGVEGIILPTGLNETRYWVRLRFGRYMIYAELTPTTSRGEQYYQMYVLPYGGWSAGEIITPEFIAPPPPPPPPAIPSRRFYEPGTPIPASMQSQHIFASGAAMFPHLPRYPATMRGPDGRLFRVDGG